MLINYWLEGDTSNWFRALNDQDVESKTKWGAATKRQSCSRGRGCKSSWKAPREKPRSIAAHPHPRRRPPVRTEAQPVRPERVCDAKHGDVFKCKIVWRQTTGRESDGTRNAFVAGCNAPQTNSAVFYCLEEQKELLNSCSLSGRQQAAVTDAPQRHRTLLCDCVALGKINPL